jgi:PKD repeat protein
MTRPPLQRAILLVLSLTFAAAGVRAAVPAAPSNLRLVSQTWNSFTFAWDDNATDETSQPLFISEGGQPFYLITAYRSNATQGALLHLNPGRLYRIYLTARNASGDSAPSNVLGVFIPVPELKSQFAWLPLRPTVDDAIAFYDGSFGSPTRWGWDFGDGTASTERNPVKRYADPGAYPVSLKVTSGTTESTSTETVTVAAGSAGEEVLVAGVDCGTCAAVAGEEVAFRDASTGGAAAWNWSFGDGAGSTERNPRHAFAAPGGYIVSLLATRGTATSMASKSVSVVAPPRPAALLIPAAARIGGGAGTEWRTELTLTNLGAVPVELTVQLLPSGGGSDVARAISLATGASRTFRDVIAEFFDLENGSGAILVTADVSEGLDDVVAQSRTFTAGLSDGALGQFIPAVRVPRSEGPLYLSGVESSETYRTNIGLVNASDRPAHVNLALMAGSAVLRAEFDLAPRSWMQQPLAGIFDLRDAKAETFAVAIESGESDVVAYASVIDNTTNDPTYIVASRKPEEARLLVPVVGRTPGAEGSLWRTDVVLLNASTAQTQVRLRVPGTSMHQDLTLGPGENRVLRDVALQLGSEMMTGALEIDAAGAPPVVVARTYTVLPSGGTLGQSVDVVASETAGVRARVTGLRHDAAVRANIGLVERSGEANAIHLELFNETGGRVATSDVTLPAHGQLQMRLTELFPATEFAAIAGPLRLDAQSADSAPFIAYASLIDNRSGDPLFILGH